MPTLWIHLVGEEEKAFRAGSGCGIGRYGLHGMKRGPYSSTQPQPGVQLDSL